MTEHNIDIYLLQETWLVSDFITNIYGITVIHHGPEEPASNRGSGGITILLDKICMMMTRLACNRAIESSYWRMDNNSDVGLLMSYVLYRLPIELESMDLDTFSR
jgi:hypothetical protein